jgi:hypothetical protein
VFKSILVGIGAAFLAIAGPAIIPIIVGILSATFGAVVIVGLSVWRTIRKLSRARGTASAVTSNVTSSPVAAPPTGRAQWDVRA